MLEVFPLPQPFLRFRARFVGSPEILPAFLRQHFVSALHFFNHCGPPPLSFRRTTKLLPLTEVANQSSKYRMPLVTGSPAERCRSSADTQPVDRSDRWYASAPPSLVRVEWRVFSPATVKSQSSQSALI